MKKTACLSLLLSLSLGLQCLALPVSAQEDVTVPGIEETHVATTPLSQQEAPTLESQFIPPSEMAFGTVSIYNGCRGLDGIMPVSNEGRVLETAQAVMVFERNTETVVYSYNPDIKLAPGTLSKIVTALVVVENVPLDAVVTCSSRNISRLPPGSQNAKIKEGEKLTVNDLLHCMILHGANDAAVALAEYVGGNQEAFVSMMNARVKKIGCTGTNLGNVHGLDNVAQHTTARDMAKILNEASKNEIIRKLIFTTKYDVPETNRSKPRSYLCQNYLISEAITPKFYQATVTGGLASYAPASGAGLICTAEHKDMDLVCVILGANRTFQENGWSADYYGNFDEMVSLLTFAFQNFRVKRVIYDGMAMNQFAVVDGANQVVGQAKVNIDTVLPNDVSMDNLRMELHPMKGGLTAPIKKDEKIATVELWYRTSCLAEAELFAMSNVKFVEGAHNRGPGQQTRNDEDTSGFLGFVKIVSAIVLIPAAIYLVFNSLRRFRAQMRHKRKKTPRIPRSPVDPRDDPRYRDRRRRPSKKRRDR